MNSTNREFRVVCNLQYVFLVLLAARTTYHPIVSFQLIILHTERAQTLLYYTLLSSSPLRDSNGTELVALTFGPGSVISRWLVHLRTRYLIHFLIGTGMKHFLSHHWYNLFLRFPLCVLHVLGPSNYLFVPLQSSGVFSLLKALAEHQWTSNQHCLFGSFLRRLITMTPSKRLSHHCNIFLKAPCVQSLSPLKVVPHLWFVSKFSCNSGSCSGNCRRSTSKTTLCNWSWRIWKGSRTLQPHLSHRFWEIFWSAILLPVDAVDLLRSCNKNRIIVSGRAPITSS